MLLELEENESGVNAEHVVDDTKWLAKYYIEMYFRDKAMYCGGPIPKHMLYTDRYISAVLNLNVCNGMDIIYNAVGVNYTDEQMRHFERQGQLPDDVKYVIYMFRELARAGIPKQFAVGILFIYLELCEGYKLKMAA
jgi:hypothetical protein